jgi:hypothetical protein
VLLLLLAACGRPQTEQVSEPQQPDPERSVSRTTELGPVKAVVSLSPTEPLLGDPLVLTLDVQAEPGVTVELPAFGEALGRFSIVDFTPRSETLPDGGTHVSQRYTLQPPMSGKQRVPPLRVEFVDERPGQLPDSGPAPVKELLTEELTVEVASVLPEGALEDQLRPVRGSLEPLANPVHRWLLLLLLPAAAGAVLGWRAWQRQRLERRKLTAYDVALKRLRALEARGLPGAQEADAWYVELSSIVRHYLEDRYAVRAPELTTEEFLREARRSRELTKPHQELLGAFLEQCDRVKFAAYRPDESESSGVLASARRFLSETRLVKDQQQSASPRAA